mmetsp:Transcript_12710/g.22652  ORF Transcript_12710/g.22652 Transcript_12710/m.22652 type:complete len:457 (+) Transcript_12710:137-1507(+)
MAPAVTESAADALVMKPDVKKKDFSEDARVEIPAASELARGGKLAEALQRLLLLEKRARLGGDHKVVSEVALVIVKLCFELEAWDELNANVTLLCKRRGQHKQVQVTVIQEAAERVEDVQDKKERLRLIETLRAISEGKIYVEAERARLTMLLAMIKEADGDVAGAADVLQEENVETYGAMNKREKVDFLLEQIRLCLAKKDYIRAFIITKKVKRNQLDEGDMEDLKIRFYELLIEYYTHEKDPLELARANIAIFRTEGIQKKEKKWVSALQASVLYLCISPFDNHQIDLVHNLLQDDKLKQLDPYLSLLKHFVTNEIAQWPLPEHDVITKNALLKDPNSWTFKMLRDRVIEHDIRVVAKYYTRISGDRLADILQLPKEEMESYISSMVTSTTSERLVAKIDRPSSVISFHPRKDANDHLSEWTTDISELLGLVEKTCHLIHKEVMLHQAKKQTKP